MNWQRVDRVTLAIPCWAIPQITRNRLKRDLDVIPTLTNTDLRSEILEVEMCGIAKFVGVALLLACGWVICTLLP